MNDEERQLWRKIAELERRINSPLSGRKISDWTVPSTTPTAVPDLSGFAVDVGAWRVRALVYWTQGAVSASQLFCLQGTPDGGTRMQVNQYEATNVSGSPLSTRQVTDNSTLFTGPLMMAPATTYVIDIDGTAYFTAADTFGLKAWRAAAGDDWTILAGSRFDLWPAK